MHYYQFNIGDYVSHTRHLTVIEDCAYRRLLDAYYLAEKPLVGDSKAVARHIGMREHEQEVAEMLCEFFQQCEEGWRNCRADKEIAHFKGKLEQASRAGKASAERRFNGRSTGVQPTNNQEPITNKQSRERSPNGSRLPPDWKMPEEYKTFCQQERPDLDPRDVENRFRDYWVGVAGAKGRKADWLATWRNWVRGDKPRTVTSQVTIPSKPGIDPALQKLNEDDRKAAPLPAEIRQKIASLTRKVG